MRLGWRFGLVAIVAAAVVGGLVPHAIVSGAGNAATEMVRVADATVSAPVTCLDATCGKGSPAPAAPSPAVALAVVLGAAVIVAATRAMIRRRRAQLLALPDGVRDPLFHPPRFS
jgi:hypothetical protein